MLFKQHCIAFCWLDKFSTIFSHFKVFLTLLPPCSAIGASWNPYWPDLIGTYLFFLWTSLILFTSTFWHFFDDFKVVLTQRLWYLWSWFSLVYFLSIANLGSTNPEFSHENEFAYSQMADFLNNIYINRFLSTLISIENFNLVKRINNKKQIKKQIGRFRIQKLVVDMWWERYLINLHIISILKGIYYPHRL